ncbi:MAG TPA: ATP-binding protein [Syntrophales bacterium]|nr:ATP-binding protein [Syntrophales bacterium]HOX94491.1 ATP-binding protein [Syntrophales bacterium]HPI55831.1 ATP-binding protein [Syntrophales bacterium]HPN23678.1 ATP-binding protein [Syntrophales bacterium]HQM27797.1 ATP-binding protein [Syntrophales bacterium]
MTSRRIRWLVIFRVLIITFLLFLSVGVQYRETQSLWHASLRLIYVLAGGTYLLSAAYLTLLRSLHHGEFNITLQAFFDVLIVSALIYYTGSIGSMYSVLYPLVIIYSALLMGRRGGLSVASACSLVYGLMLYLAQKGYIPSSYPGQTQSAGLTPEFVLTRAVIHIASFYIVALLTSFAVEQEKKLRMRLAEKENALDKLDQFHRSIIESVETGILTVDLTGRIKSLNRAAEELTGFSAGEVEGEKIDEVFPGFMTVLEQVNAEGGKSSRKRFETAVSQKSGQKIILGFSFSSLYDRERRIGDILIFQDLTAIKEMEAQAEKNKRLAFIGEMAAGLAHDLRNPLLSISGSIQMLQRDLKLDSTDERLMKVILRAKDQLENLIKNFLIFARTTARDRGEMQLNEVLDETLDALKEVPDWNDNIEVGRAYQNVPPVFGNRTEIRQTLWNILVNAVQSMPDGGSLSIETSALPGQNGNGFVHVRISDTGCGIEGEILDKVVEPFYTTKEGGTGLGLAIVSRIVESHGGRVSIESEVHRGTTCSVTFPFRKEQSEGPPAEVLEQ